MGKYILPQNNKKTWQSIVNIIAEIITVNAAIIIRGEQQSSCELIAASSPENCSPEPEDICELVGSYCERVMDGEEMLCITDAPYDKNGRDHSEIDMDLISFLGYPLARPDGTILGTICVFDRRERYFSRNQQELVRKLKMVIENQLEDMYLKEQLEKRTGKLSEEKERLEMAINGADLGLWDWNIKTGEVKINENWARMMGYAKDEVNNGYQLWKNSICKDDYGAVMKSINRHLEGKTPFYRSEHRIRTKKGTWKWIMDIGEVVSRDGEGKPVRAVGIHMDIDKRKKTELQLKKSEAKFRSYIRNAPVGIFIINEEGNFLNVNKTVTRLTGYTRHELLNMSVAELPVAEDVNRTLEDFTKLKDEGELTGEYRLRKKNGAEFYVKINSVKLSGSRFLGFAEDIDCRRRTERVLKRQKAYFQQLFDKSPEAIALMDNQEHIIRVNESFEKIFGYKLRNIEGRKINTLIVPEGKMAQAVDISKKVKEGKTYTGESVRRTKNGREIYVSITGYPITLEGNQLGVYAIYNDITERKEEEEKIKYLSFHDQLTGLYNRRYIENEVDRLDKSRKLPVSILVADMDGLKIVNDNYGHREGDRYLEITANIINNSVREEDIVARIGGDEFAVLLPHSGNRIAEEIKERIEAGCKRQNEELNEPISISVGYATKRTPDGDLNEVFKRADNNMYREKKEKKTYC